MNLLLAIVAGGKRLRPGTKLNYGFAVREWLAFAGEVPDGWSPYRVEKFYLALRRKMTTASANNVIAGVRYASRRYASVHGGVDFAAAIETERPEERAPPVALSRADIHRLLQACRGTAPADLRDRALVILGVTTGLRRDGLAGIAFGDFKLARGFDYQTAEVTLKGGRRFAVPLLDGALAAILPWRKWLASQEITSGRFFRSVSLPTIQGPRTIGKAISNDGVYKCLSRRARAANVTGYHPHAMRHAFVTFCRSAGVPLHEIAAITGHQIEGSGVIDRVYSDQATIGASALRSIAPVFAEFFATAAAGS